MNNNKPPNKAEITNSQTSVQTQVSSLRMTPIPPPSHPKQYRAIGLVRGKYKYLEDHLTRGTLITADGRKINSVLLGRTINIIKKHIDLEKEHLWVVYPHTKQENDELHLQIVGVWEPKTLAGRDSSSIQLKEEYFQEEYHHQNGYFSVRGEVIFYSQETEIVIVKILQSAKTKEDKTKHLKLKLRGTLPNMPLEHFWDLNVLLQGNQLIIQEGVDLGLLAAKKKKFIYPKRSKTQHKPFPKGSKPGDYVPTNREKTPVMERPFPKNS